MVPLFCNSLAIWGAVVTIESDSHITEKAIVLYPLRLSLLCKGTVKHPNALLAALSLSDHTVPGGIGDHLGAILEMEPF